MVSYPQYFYILFLLFACSAGGSILQGVGTCIVALIWSCKILDLLQLAHRSRVFAPLHPLPFPTPWTQNQTGTPGKAFNGLECGLRAVWVTQHWPRGRMRNNSQDWAVKTEMSTTPGLVEVIKPLPQCDYWQTTFAYLSCFCSLQVSLG